MTDPSPATPIGPATKWWGFRFSDVTVEEEYWSERVGANRAYLRNMGAAGVLIVAMALISNEQGRSWPVLPASELRVLRAWALAEMALFFALVLATWFARPWKLVDRVSILVAYGLVGVHETAYFMAARPFSLGYFIGLNTTVIVAIGLTRIRFHASAILGVVTLLGFIVGTAAVGDFGYEGRAGLIMYVFMAAAFAVLVASQTDRLTRLAFASRAVQRMQQLQVERLAGDLREAHAKSEREVSHQVAARSRELGQMLARIDATFVVGKLGLGELFDTRYRVERELGAGGMGAVYEVARLTDQRRLALKIVTGDVSGVNAARFAREAEIGADVHHPNVISIVDVGIAQGVPFLAMELAARGTLEERRERFGDPAWALPVLGEIAAGLAALHTAGVVHRDLKPANVLFVEGDVAKISDFGISRFGALDVDHEVDPHAKTLGPTPPLRSPAKPQGLTATGMLLGTPYYMAPEGARGGRIVEAPADVFAFGILACEMLTGRPPFVTPPVFLAMSGQSLPSVDLAASVPEKLRSVLLDCLAEDPAKRPTMGLVGEALSVGA